MTTRCSSACRSGFSPTRSGGSGFSLTLLLCLLLPLSTFAATPIHQLRIYEIFDHNKQAFHDRFRDHAMRIMTRYDFHIVAQWEAKNGERTEFVYLLEWPDEVTMKDRWAKFMADQEWSGIKKQTAAKYGKLVGDIQDRTLHLTPYSPRKELLSEN
jgi:NIPSNAP protein